MGEFVVEVVRDRFQGLSKVVGDASARTSFRSRFLHGCALVTLLITLNTLGAVAVRAEPVTNAAGVIEAQLWPLLDSLTEAASSMAESSRTSGSPQLGLTINEVNNLMATVRSPDMAVALGKKSKTLQKSLSRFESQLLKAKAAVDSSAITDAAAWKAILKAVASGQQLKALVPTLPSSGTVVMLREVKSSGMVLHSAGDTVCFHVDILNPDGDPSCGPMKVSASPVSGIGTLELTNEPDFCLTMGPDAGLVQVTVSTCNERSSMLLYDYGAPHEPSPTPTPSPTPSPAPAPAPSPAPTPPPAPTPSPVSTPPAAPSNLTGRFTTPTSIALTWQDNSDNELGFQIQRAKSPGGPWSVVGIVGANVTSYTDTHLAPSTTYYYRVGAFN